jgi:V/A-type H+-transporting ATPase subunit A
LILLTSEIIKDGYLQQNSFDEIDMYCVPEKQVRLLELIMEFHERSKNCIKLGAPLSKISSMGLKESLSRLKSTVANDSLGDLDSFEAKMVSSLDELERSYRARKTL